MLSIYIHWPFCLSKCPYCDFNSHVAASIDHSPWINAYKAELKYFSDQISGQVIKSIFFGGGTPSLMNPSTVQAVIDEIARMAIVTGETEITLEANPTSFEVEKFKNFKTAGVNRISIGVQSLRPKDLENLGRNHDVKTAINAIESAATIFPKYSFDLIYARSGQTLKDWQKELSEALEIAGGHISLYQLTIEKGTPFYKLFHDGKLILPDNDTAADMYEWTNEVMTLKGYNRYEISNYAIDSHECQHNLTYWNYNTYIGIGPGAHSRIINRNECLATRVKAIMMSHNPDKWLSNVTQLGQGIQSSQFLNIQEIATESIMMGLRLKKGISKTVIENLTSLPISDVLNFENLEHYENQGLLKHEDDSISLTDKGLILHNYLVPRLILDVFEQRI